MGETHTAAGAPEFPPDDVLAAVEAAARELITEAGGIVLERRASLDVEYKGGNRSDPVTEVDRAVEAFLARAVAERFPGHAVLGEEGQEPNGAVDWEWIVDPVDGTLNFVHGLPLYAVSIGVLHKRRPVVGALLFPALGETLWARRGGGAWRNGEPIRVRSGEGRKAFVAGLPVGYRGGFRAGKSFRAALAETRSLGSIAYEMGVVASGGLDLAVFRGPKVWDVAGGAVIVAEAGGTILVHSKRRGAWLPLERFTAPPTGGLRAWSRPVLVGAKDAADALAPHIAPRYAPALAVAATAARSAAKRGYLAARSVQ